MKNLKELFKWILLLKNKSNYNRNYTILMKNNLQKATLKIEKLIINFFSRKKKQILYIKILILKIFLFFLSVKFIKTFFFQYIFLSVIFINSFINFNKMTFSNSTLYDLIFLFLLNIFIHSYYEVQIITRQIICPIILLIKINYKMLLISLFNLFDQIYIIYKHSPSIFFL